MENKVSIVVPVYNSSGTLAELAERLFTVFNQQSLQGELVLVDDGSTDKSWETILALKEKYGEPLKGIRLARNFGQHNALCCGFFHASGNLIVTMDDDLQHPPEEIVKLVDCYRKTQADVVYGMPAETKKGAIRKLGSAYVKRTSAFYRKGGKGGSPFRLLRKDLVQKIVSNHNHHFVYVDAIINWYTASIAHTNVEFDVRKNGKSGYSFYRLFKLYFELTYNYSANPLRWVIRVGIICAVLSFTLGGYFIYRKLFHHVPLGYTSVMAAITFSTGLIMISLGVIGLYIQRLYQLQYHKPSFYVETIV